MGSNSKHLKTLAARNLKNIVAGKEKLLANEDVFLVEWSEELDNISSAELWYIDHSKSESSSQTTDHLHVVASGNCPHGPLPFGEAESLSPSLWDVFSLGSQNSRQFVFQGFA